MRKGVIARYEQFLLFPQCFQKACFPGASNGVIVWEWVKSLPNNNFLDCTKFKAFKAFADNILLRVAKILISVYDRVENIVGNGENAGYQLFLFFPQCFQKASFFRVVKSGDCLVKN